MLSHIMLGSSNIEKSKSFYNAVLGVLGAGAPIENKNDTGQNRLFYVHDGSTFSVSEPINGEPVSTANGFTIGSVEDPPGPRESTMGTFNLCYFLDPDGHKICGIHRPK